MRLSALAVVLLVAASLLPVEARRSKIHLGKPHPEAKPERKDEHITFDPLVSEVERHRDDEAWEKEYEKLHHEHHHVEAGHHHEHEDNDLDATIDEYHDEDAEHEEFLHDAGVDDPDSLEEDTLDHINMEKRIDRLFPLIDIAPADGKIDVNELTAWELMQYQQMQDHRMERELEALDKDNDGVISLKEYLHDESPGDKVKHWKEYPESEQEYHKQEFERFEVADEDGDGKLNKEGLYMVLHPEESENPRMHAHMRLEELRNYDVNKNGRIEVEEWLEGFWHIIHDWEEEERKWTAKYHQKPYQEPKEDLELKKGGGRKLLRELDRDGDGALSAEELEPIMHIMMPSEKHFSEQTARHLVEQADDDNDAQLTMHEMKKHKHVFYELERSADEDD